MTTTPNTCPVTGAKDELPPMYPFDAPAALDPPPEWAELREQCPVARIRMVSGDEALLLTRYDDVKAMLSDPRFTRDLVADDAAQVGTGETSSFNRQVEGDAASAALQTMMSGPGHTRWRRLVGRSFTVKRVMALQPRIAEIANELIDEMVAHGAPADLRSELGFPLPVYVICELLGVPRTDHAKFAHWSDMMLNLSAADQDDVAASIKEFGAYMAGHVQEKRAHPGGDLLSELAAVVDAQDGQMSEGELIATGQALLVAGHETSANMIGKMVSMLLAKRERWEQLLADRSLVKPAVEESLRFDANSGFGMPRYVSEPVDVGGVTLPPGTTVISSMAAANRDERAFTGADDMDLTRSPNPHVSFGAGSHSCIGQSLARVELQTVLTVLLDRLPTLELAIPSTSLHRREGLIVGGLEEVPVQW